MGKSKHVKAFEESHARPDESVVTTCDGFTKQRTSNGFKEVNGVLILTDERVVFYRKGFFGEHLVGIETKEIASIDRSSSWGTHTLLLRSPTGAIEFNTYVRKNVAGDLVSAIEAQRSAIAALGSGPGNVADELRKLSELAADGILSSEEFERAKGLFLGKPVTRQDEAARLLRNLHELHRQGTLTEGEFNMKKWDILSKP